MMSTESNDEDLRELFLRTQPIERSVNVQQIVMHAVNGRRSQRDLNTPEQRRRLMTIRAGVLVAAIGLIFFFVGPLVSEKGIAFAEVQAQVERVRTVEYVQTSYDGDIPVPDGAIVLAEPTIAETISRLEKNLPDATEDLAEDIKFQLGVFKCLEESTVLIVQRVRIKGKHLERTDQLYPYDTTQGYSAPPYDVRNARNGLTVSFYPLEKKRTVLKKQVVINNENGKQSESDIEKIPRTVDFFARFRKIPAKATEKLDQRIIDGHEVVGFRSVEIHGDETWTRTHWVGIKSKLPVEIVTELHKGKVLSQRWVANRFVFDHEMADQLFDTETPAGYKSEDGKVLGIRP